MDGGCYTPRPHQASRPSAIVFTSLAIGIVALSAWWLFLSPLKSADRSRRMSPTLAIAMAGALGVSAALMVSGALWDASMLLLTGLVPREGTFSGRLT